MPKQSYLQKQVNGQKRKVKKAARSRYENARDKAQQKTMNAIGAAGRGTGNLLKRGATGAWKGAGRVVGQRRAKVKEHTRTVNGKTIVVAQGGMTKGREMAGRKPATPPVSRKLPANYKLPAKPAQPRHNLPPLNLTHAPDGSKLTAADYVAPGSKPKAKRKAKDTGLRPQNGKPMTPEQNKRYQEARAYSPKVIETADGKRLMNMNNPHVMQNWAVAKGHNAEPPDGWVRDGLSGYKPVGKDKPTLGAKRSDGMPYSDDDLELLSHQGFDISAAKQASVKQWAKEDGKNAQRRAFERRGI